MTINELEETYQQLHERLLRGELDEESFKAQVEQLRFEDEQGNQWKIGWYTGQWYRYDQGQWVQGKPSQQKTPGAAAVAPERPDREPKSRSLAWLAPALIGLLVIAALALVAGWNLGWWSTPEESTASAAETPSAASSTPIAAAETVSAPTAVAQSTRQAAPTATSQPTEAPAPTAAASATEAPSPAPSEPPSPQPTSSASPAPTAAASNAARPGLSGRIFFPVYDAERKTFDIYAYDLASGDRTLVVEEASQPAISPKKGQRLAYRSWNKDHRSIRVQELADGHTWTWINFAEAARPSWSPDSENIVFPSQQEPDREWRLYYTIGLEFDRVRRQGGDIKGRVPAWLADGRIAYWECPLNKCGLYVMQSDGTSPLRLTTFEHDTDPAGSPDAEQIAFMSSRDGNWEIYTASTHPSGGIEAKRLTQNAGRDGLPTWSPDGQWLAFVTDRDGRWAMWAMRPDGSDQHKLFDLGGPLEGEIARVVAGEQHGWTWESIAWGP